MVRVFETLRLVVKFHQHFKLYRRGKMHHLTALYNNNNNNNNNNNQFLYSAFHARGVSKRFLHYHPIGP